MISFLETGVHFLCFTHPDLSFTVVMCRFSSISTNRCRLIFVLLIGGNAIREI